MPKLKIGITLETLGQPLRTAVATAAKAGIQGLVFDAVKDFAPRQLGETARRELRHLVAAHQMQWIALRTPLRRGLDELDGLEARLERLKEALALAADLGPRLLLLGVGAIPENADDPVRLRLQNALGDLVRHADRIGCRIALDASLEPPEVLSAFLRSFDTGNLGASVDPAALLIEKLPLDSTLRTLAGFVWHTYARDAVSRRLDRSAREVPLGQGDIDWFSWLATLEEIGYSGWLTIRQSPYTQPLPDAQAAVHFLRRLGVGSLT
jgi:L-ribulose-5-phosphate 3-epimerase